MSAKVAVVIPLYNVSKHLRQCLDSVIAQSLRDLQIILVNDGSEDSSLEIAQEYARNDPRIEVVDKANGGAGSARNEGFKRVKAEFVYFCDGDDWLDLQLLEKFYTLLKQTGASLALCGAWRSDERGI